MTSALCILFVLWFLPVIVAFGRGCRARRCIAITIITACLSWTIVAWVLALVWAIDSEGS